MLKSAFFPVYSAISMSICIAVVPPKILRDGSGRLLVSHTAEL